MHKDKLKTFNDNYSTYYRKCFLFAKSYVHNSDVADDIASDAMIKLWQNLIGANDILNTQAFLMKVVKNLSLNFLYHEQIKLNAHQSILDVAQREINFRISNLEACDPESIFSDELRTLFDQTLDSLPEQTRQIFILSRNDDKSTKEIALQFGISIKGVDYHISKALKALRTNLKDYLPSLLIMF